MVEKIGFKCGQIFILSTDNFLLVCEYCEDSFSTLESLRSHLEQHCPRLPATIENADSDCEIIPTDLQDDFHEKAALQSTNEDLIPAAVNYSEIIKSEQSEGYQRKRPLHRTFKANDMNSGARRQYRFKSLFECRFCRKRFRGNTQLSNHENAHTGARPHKCHICHTTYSATTNLLKHYKNTHANEPKHVCQVCERSFYAKIDLKHHISEKHLSVPPLRLQRHRRTHTKRSATFCCNYCRKQFKLKRHILQHMLVHTDQIFTQVERNFIKR